MGFDWEQDLGAKGAGLADVYDERASDALYQDHPTAAPPGAPVDVGDADAALPFDEE
ncbi:hypothetical protein PUN71_013560 [Arthrobacter sp. NQ7]|uniref:hypothetical protein n=1 Tax=Arthrobacter sp. NQ7 TaxID=3032303 RepID=UPI00240FA166|nr:hypothetical protein [Arthrobacter sp. NQ7]MDJ0458228.1 hypothetical protein [Arthrobacter sp. NQ7]